MLRAWLVRLAILAAVLGITTSPALARTGTKPHRPPPPVVILVSIDGFRPDYLERGVTPNLNRLAATGAVAPMRPSFPSKTFPNHWTLVTGLRPDHHGITANRIEDPARPGQVFTMANDDPFWWGAATPLWIDAERAGIRTATMFWPGSNVSFGGTRPHDWHQYNQAVDNPQRVAGVIDWLRRPLATRPRFITLYFDTVDTAGHDFGPADPRTTAAIAEVDARIGDLVRGLAALHQAANLVIVADHGMAEISPSRVIRFDELVDPALFRVIESGPFLTIEPTAGNAERLAAALPPRGDHFQCWPRATLPARLVYGSNARVPAFLCLAETGWMLLAAQPAHAMDAGTHGFDPADPQMAALFIAVGPRIRAKVRLAPFDNIAVEPLLRNLLGMLHDPATDGDITPLQGALRP